MGSREASRGSLRALLVVAAAIVGLLSPAVSDASASGAIEGEITGPGGIHIAQSWACAYLVQSEEFEESCDMAGSNGLYAIQGLKAGKYKVEFWSEATEPAYAGEFYDDKPFWEEADEVEVKEGVASTGIDAELAEGATIEGEVRAASLGGPVEHALVCAQISTGEPIGCIQVRSDGSYALAGLPAAEYKVQFVPASNLYNLLNQFYDHESSFAAADLLSVAAGETKTGIDADLEAGAEIRGTVYSAATGAPAPGVLVCVLVAEPPPEEGALRQCRETSSTGSYAFRGLETSSYKVAFSPEYKEVGIPFEEEADGYLTQYFDGKPTLAAADPIAMVAPGVRTGIDGHLQPEHPASPLAPVFSPVIGKAAPRRRVARHCRAGFRKKKVAGKRRCVKIHKRKHRHRGHRSGRGKS